jgi:hypothetical protein
MSGSTRILVFRVVGYDAPESKVSWDQGMSLRSVNVTNMTCRVVRRQAQVELVHARQRNSYLQECCEDRVRSKRATADQDAKFPSPPDSHGAGVFKLDSLGGEVRRSIAGSCFRSLEPLEEVVRA